MSESPLTNDSAIDVISQIRGRDQKELIQSLTATLSKATLSDQSLSVFNLSIRLINFHDDRVFASSVDGKCAVDCLRRFVLNASRNPAKLHLLDALVKSLSGAQGELGIIDTLSINEIVSVLVDELDAFTRSHSSLSPNDPRAAAICDAVATGAFTPRSEQASLPSDAPISFHSISNRLIFLKVIFWRTSVGHEELARRLLRACLLLLKAEDLRLAASIKDTVSAIVIGADALGCEFFSSSSCFIVYWDLIHDAMGFSNGKPALQSCVMSIWLILVSHRNSKFHVTAGEQHQYWMLLQDNLARGSNEQMKLSLSIFRSSVEELSPSATRNLISGAIVSSSELRQICLKYSALFEMILFGQNVTQVESALPTLIALADAEVTMKPSWFLALARAALHERIQTNVRNLVGNWMLKSGKGLLFRCADESEQFLEVSLLPWLITGSFYSSITRLEDGKPLCVHGERARAFVCDIVRNTTDDSLRTRFIAAILRFLSSKKSRILSYARAFILEGLTLAVSSERLKVNDTIKDWIYEIANVSGFQPVVADLMTFQCATLLHSLPKSKQDYHTSMDFKEKESRLLKEEGLFNVTSKTIPIASKPPMGSILARNPQERDSLQKFSMETKDTHALNVRGRDLGPSCSWILYALNAQNDESFNAAEFIIVLKAIWDEIERQKYPKTATLLISYIVLHPRAVASLEAGSSMFIQVLEICTRLQEIWLHRIYVFSAMADALRQSLCFAPPAYAPILSGFVIAFARQPPTAEVETDLERIMASKLQKFAPLRSYEAYYGRTQEFGYACAFDVINRLPDNDIYDAEASNALTILLRPWLQQKEPLPVFSQWKSATQLQVIIILLKRCTNYQSEHEIRLHLRDILRLLEIELLPRFRYLLEWAIVMLQASIADDLCKTLKNHLSHSLNNTRHTVSLIKIFVSLAFLPTTSDIYGVELFTQLVIQSSSTKVAIRHEAQWSIPFLWQLASDRGWNIVTHNPLFKQFQKHITSLDAYQTPPSGRLHRFFHPSDDSNLVNLVAGAYMALEPPERPKLGFEDVARLFNEDAKANGCSSYEKFPPTLPIKQTEGPPTKLTVSQNQSKQSEYELSSRIGELPFQTKGDITSLRSLELMTGAAKPRRRLRKVIVVASLIDINFNLGGISRVSEIFGAESMQVRRRDVIKSSEFKSVSVASETWLSIEQLELNELSGFFRDCRVEGYTIVGIEQTDSSKILGEADCRLPEKMVFVIGNEAMGMPANILAEMDICVEIKQSGFTKSMNVQTAVAVALYEYCKQHP